MIKSEDIITSVKNLETFLKVPELKGAIVRTKKNGTPYYFTGGFNVVFQLNHKKKKWAFRVWFTNFGLNLNRSHLVSEYLHEKSLPYFVNFIYDEKGILVNGEFLDTIRMEWVEGALLKDFISKHLNQSNILESLSKDFITMCADLRNNKISHGDLQEENIIIDENNQIKLIDYDSVCIPVLEGEEEFVTGKKGYQHPSRLRGGKSSLKADYFSELIIYLSILALAEKPSLWEKYQVMDSAYMLFTEFDFEDFEKSNIFKELSTLSRSIINLLAVLKIYVECEKYEDLKPFNWYFQPPRIVNFSINKSFILEGQPVELTWNVENAMSVTISPEIGRVQHVGNLLFQPNSSNYTITATGISEEIEEKLFVKSFPLPLIESIFTPFPIINKQMHLEITMPKFIDINISIKSIRSGISINYNNIHVEMPNFNDAPHIGFPNLKNHPKYSFATSAKLVFRFLSKQKNKFLKSIKQQ